MDDLAPVTTLRAPLNGIVTAVAFVPGAPVLVASISNGQFRVWDIADPAAPRELATRSGDDLISTGTVAVSAGGDTLAASGADGTVLVWDIGDPAEPVLRATLTGHTGNVGALAFSAEGALLASGSDDDTVRLWNLADVENPRAYGCCPAPRWASNRWCTPPTAPRSRSATPTPSTSGTSPTRSGPA